MLWFSSVCLYILLWNSIFLTFSGFLKFYFLYWLYFLCTSYQLFVLLWIVKLFHMIHMFAHFQIFVISVHILLDVFLTVFFRVFYSFLCNTIFPSFLGDRSAPSSTFPIYIRSDFLIKKTADNAPPICVKKKNYGKILMRQELHLYAMYAAFVYFLQAVSFPVHNSLVVIV